MKKIKFIIISLLAVFLLSNITNINAVKVSAPIEFYPISLANQDEVYHINNENYIDYNKEHNDTDSLYHLSDTFEMDLSKVWETYNTVKKTALDNHVYAWYNFKVTAEWTITFKVDTTKVDVNESMLTLENVEEASRSINTNSDFFDYIKPYYVDYDSTSGLITIKYHIDNNGMYNIEKYGFDEDTDYVLPEIIDKFIDTTPTVLGTTPDGFLTMKQSKLHPIGTTEILATDISMKGSLTVKNIPGGTTGILMRSFLPITFNEKAPDMVVKVVNPQIIVKYQDENGNSIQKDEEINGKIEDIYEAKEKEIRGYLFVSKSDNYTGTIQEDTNEIIILTYKALPGASVVVHYVDTENNTIASDKTYSGNHNDKYNVEIIDIKDYTYLNSKGDALSGTFDYEQTHEITLIYEKIIPQIIDIDNIIEKDEVIYEKGVKTIYSKKLSKTGNEFLMLFTLTTLLGSTSIIYLKNNLFS